MGIQAYVWVGIWVRVCIWVRIWVWVWVLVRGYVYEYYHVLVWVCLSKSLIHSEGVLILCACIARYSFRQQCMQGKYHKLRFYAQAVRSTCNCITTVMASLASIQDLKPCFHLAGRWFNVPFFMTDTQPIITNCKTTSHIQATRPTIQPRSSRFTWMTSKPTSCRQDRLWFAPYNWYST